MDGGGISDHSLGVEPEEVRAVGRYAFGMASALRSALDTAAREVDSLTSNGWTGTASASFADGWRECHGGGTDIIDALESLAEKLGVTAANYRSTDNSFASDISSLNL